MNTVKTLKGTYTQLVSWSLTSLFSTNTAMSETKGPDLSSLRELSVKESKQYINLNPGHLFVQQPPKKGKGSRGTKATYPWKYST